MIDYIERMLADLPESFDGIAATPATCNLFTIDPNAVLLGVREAEFFHTNTAKLLFLCKRARPDTSTVTSFLCTRVSRPDVDDAKKLRRAMQYLRGSIALVLILEADDLRVFRWWVDGSYGVHHDLRGHTGGNFTLGKGTVIGISTKQKINTRSYTETELVSVDDCMPYILWVLYFITAQGYPVDENILYQDNISSIHLEKNGKASSSKRTKHINIRYFFITDRIKAGEVKVEHCPSKDMIADFFTKPLQGQLFYKLRALIMNNDTGPIPKDENALNG